MASKWGVTNHLLTGMILQVGYIGDCMVSFFGMFSENGEKNPELIFLCPFQDPKWDKEKPGKEFPPKINLQKCHCYWHGATPNVW